MKLFSILLAFRVIALGAVASDAGISRSKSIEDWKVAIHETSGFSQTFLKTADHSPNDADPRNDLGDFVLEGDDDSEDEKKFSSLLLESCTRVAPLVSRYAHNSARPLGFAPLRGRSTPLLM